jgi:hypothetical protein
MNQLETNQAVINGFRDLVADKVRISDASGWSSRLVYTHLLGYRNKLLFEKLRDPKYRLSTLNYQAISCIGLDEVPIEECPCQPTGDYTFLRSITPLPNIIGEIKSVNSGLRSKKYDYVDWDNFRYKLNSRFESERSQPYFSVKKATVKGVTGNFLYIYNDELREFVTLTAIFSDPLDVARYPDCTGKIDKCLRPLQREFVLDPQLKPLMYDLALQQLLKGKVPVSDTVNNNLDDVSNNKNELK